MECPSCHEQSETLTCAQCGSTFCEGCQPYWDYTGEICQGCQEYNSITAFKDDAWTARMRRWFTKKLPAPIEPQLNLPLPWRAVQCLPGYATGWLIYSGDNIVFHLEKGDKNLAEFICSAANAHYQLSGLAVEIYNRIRAGEPWFDGSERDCKLWQNVKRLLSAESALKESRS